MDAPQFTKLPDLSAKRVGGAVLVANDEFFAPKENLLKPTKPVWREGKYTNRGKWMDGWETRRRRTPGHDWAIVQLGMPGVIRGVVVDTSYFTGNYPERVSIDAVSFDGKPSAERLQEDDVPWDPLVLETPIKGDTLNFIPIDSKLRATHVRLNIFPDGGVARLHVHGDVVPDEELFRSGKDVDLAAMENGGLVIASSDEHYGNPNNLILPGRSTHMGDGWETKRRRGPGHDWAIVRLGRRGVINRVKLDTDHYKGNAPGSCMLEYCDAGKLFNPDAAQWNVLVPEVSLHPDARHRWEDLSPGPATHVRLNIYPDGGVARLRLFGHPDT
jgi:allantoicase